MREDEVSLRNTTGNNVNATAKAWEDMASVGGDSAANVDMANVPNVVNVSNVADLLRAAQTAAQTDIAERTAAEAGDSQTVEEVGGVAGGSQTAEEAVVVATDGAETVAEENVETLTPEAEALSETAREFFGEKFPEMSDEAREVRVEQAIQAGLSRMDEAKAQMVKSLTLQGKDLPEGYDAELLQKTSADMGRVLGRVYGKNSQVWREELGDSLNKNEEIAWDLAAETHKPGTLDLIDLYVQNPRHAGEEPEEYKERLHNYTQQNSRRKEQLAKDAEMADKNSDLAIEFGELRSMASMDADLRKKFPRTVKMMEVSRARPENERDENGEIDLTWFYELRPRGDEETVGDYHMRMIREGMGLTNEEVRQFCRDMAENAMASIAMERAEKEKAVKEKANTAEATEEVKREVSSGAPAEVAVAAQEEAVEKMPSAEREGKVKRLFGKLRERLGWNRVVEKVMGAFAKDGGDTTVVAEVEEEPVAQETQEEAVVETEPAVQEIVTAQEEIVPEEVVPEETVVVENEPSEKAVEDNRNEAVATAQEQQFVGSEREQRLMRTRDLLVKRLAAIPKENESARLEMAKALDDVDVKILEIQRDESMKRARAAERNGSTKLRTEEYLRAEDFALSTLMSRGKFTEAHDMNGVEKMREMIVTARAHMLEAMAKGNDIEAEVAREDLGLLRMALPALEREVANNMANSETLAEVVPIETPANESDLNPGVA